MDGLDVIKTDLYKYKRTKHRHVNAILNALDRLGN